MTTIFANSAHARDIAAVLHPQTDARRHLEVGPQIITRGHGIYVYDDSGRAFMEGAAGLWCASLGFSNGRLAETAKQAMLKLKSSVMPPTKRPSIFARSCCRWHPCR